ncbi:MAG: small, acid-soluble spore protein, alpha/beta type [Lachnospiraceae bacterium]
MGKKKKEELRYPQELSEEEKMKYEIAAEMGLLDRVLTDGWESLSAKETGSIGGKLGSYRRRK